MSFYAWTKGGAKMTTTERLSVVVPADWVAGPPQGQWAYADYAALPDDGKCYEVVKGVLYMSPSPTPGHQDVNCEILGYLRQFVKLPGLGRVFAEPTDVELSPGNIVKPDVFVILKTHLERITSARIVGAPDLVVEILSPGTMRHDLHAKFDAYVQAEVPEYWIVNPAERVVELLVLERGVYRSLGVFQGEAVLSSQIVPDWSVRTEQLFAYL
jgi:Uma2 family endonuclease